MEKPVRKTLKNISLTMHRCRFFVSILALLLAATLYPATSFAVLPGPDTPGATDPRITQSNIFSTICVPGWSKSHRPPVSVTNALKHEQLPPGADPRQYEEDHLIPLELGGASANPKNLWPEPNDAADSWGSGKKDALENRLHSLVCDGQIPLVDAQRAIRTDWQAAYGRYVGTAEPAPARQSKNQAGGAPECGAVPFVWVNIRTGVYHYPGSRWYGQTALGSYLCEKAALAEGDRAAKNGQ
jgi:hypothetical protein